MKVTIKYRTTSYGCQENKEGVVGNWMSAGEATQTLDITPNPKLSLLVQAIKQLEQPYQFGNSYTVYSGFQIVE